MNSNYFDLLRNNLPVITEDLFSTLTTCFKGLNDLVYDGDMKGFVYSQGFTQPSASIANKRHTFWRYTLNRLGVKTLFNKDSDLISEAVIPRLSEVKGAASITGKYNAWQGGQKYKKRPDKRLFFLSQECYDLNALALMNLKVTLAYISCDRFKIVGPSTTNRTVLNPKDLLNEDIIAAYEIRV